ncbi:S-layer homology domain-containing protein [Cohnella sp. WQ 127256]|uniref:S-layer homology domain-containing protein n=1 Tax=Cohnella sp. WQ 127256 TaxID=2938790 RepID=UPI0021194989|nr:S-layer homology domain-containing protein [Cohnella sp. WQ 127256]
MVRFNFNSDMLSGSEHLYVRYSDGTVYQVPEASGATVVQAHTDITKTIVGGYVSDGIRSWVPNYTYAMGDNVDVSGITVQKPAFAADHAEQWGEPTPVPDRPGFVKVTYKVYSANDEPVNGRAEIFAYSTDPNLTFYNTDALDQQGGGHTRIDTVKGGFSSYTDSGLVTFVIQSSVSEISTLPISLYSGPKLIWTNPNNPLNSIEKAAVTIASPVLGVSPQNTATVETATAHIGYTVTNVTWNEALTANGKFKAGQAYSATVVLTSKNSKQFQAGAFTPTVVNSATVGTTTTSAPGEGNSVTFTVTFPPTDALKLVSIAVGAQPTKMFYAEAVNDRLALDGMTVIETYNDGSIGTVTFASGTAAGYTTSPANGEQLTIEDHDETAVEITHTESGYTATTSDLSVTTASTNATLTSTIGTVSTGGTANETITNIPYGTTLAALKTAITPAPDATVEVYKADGTTVATALTTGNKVIVTAQDGVTKVTYTVTVNAASANATLTSTIGTVSTGGTANETITNIPYGTTLAALKTAITPAPDATVEVYKADGTTVATALTTGNKVIVTAQDGVTKVTYTVAVELSSVATMTSTIGTVSTGGTANETITNIPYGTTLAALKAVITPAPDATVEVYEADGTTVATVLTTGNKVIVTAQDGVTKVTYSVAVELSSVATMTSTIGTVSTGGTANETITNIPYGTTLAALKAAITPAPDATVEVYEADGTTIATALATGNKVIVTAQDGVTTVTYTVAVKVALSTSATLTSTIGTVSIGGTANETITNIPYGTTLAVLKAAITPAPDATVEVYEADGTTVATALATGNKVIVTAQDGVTKVTYTVTVKAASSGGGGGGGVSSTPTDGKLTLPTGQSGQVSLGDAVTVTIPTGASSKELKLTIAKLLDTQNLLKNNQVLASSIYEILKNFPENFNKPVTLTFVFDPTSVKKDQRPAIFYYDEVKKVWLEVTSGKINGNRISVEVDHFTKFAVFVVDPTVVVPEPEQPKDTTSEVKFSDIAKHWAEASIKQAVYGGIVKGYTDGTFKPNATVTRAEFAVMLMNVLKLQGNGAKLTFTDNAKIGAWAQNAVAQAVQAGIIKGNQDGSFRPNAEVTRAEMAVMIASALGQPIEANTATGFADDKDIPAWAKGSVAIVKQASIVQGKSGNKFSPQDNATRAEAITVLLKMLEQMNK